MYVGMCTEDSHITVMYSKFSPVLERNSEMHKMFVISTETHNAMLRNVLLLIRHVQPNHKTVPTVV